MKTCYLIGVGMGNPDTLTMGAKKQIEACGQLIGAKRLLEDYASHPGKKLALIGAKDIAQAVEAFPGDTAVLLSGDVGFYSGASGLYPLLKEVQVEAMPGISSLNYFCAKLHIPWQDVKLLSVHGREANALGEMQSHEKTFFLTGSNCTPSDLCRQLCQAGLGDVTVHVGERLSYPDEKITSGRAEDLAGKNFDPLSVVLTENRQPTVCRPGVPALWDRELIRGKTPMTKENIRILSVARLGIQPGHTVWDVGAGTGSVSAACAMAAWKGQVYAVERDGEALELIQKNREGLKLWNLHVIAGSAPQMLNGLPAPDRVFIGGSGGSMGDIFRMALEKNPAVRFCLTAVSLESLTEGLTCMKEFDLQNVDVTQITAAQSKILGDYHMMLGQNPVWILSGEGRP